MNEKEFALYNGDEFIMVGTKHEIARKHGYSIDTMHTYSKPSHVKRNNEKGMILVELEENQEEEESE